MVGEGAGKQGGLGLQMFQTGLLRHSPLQSPYVAYVVVGPDPQRRVGYTKLPPT